MNSQVAFLQWVRANHPQVLAAAVAKVQRKTSLGGLGDDLLSDISFDSDTVSAADNIDFSNSSTAAAPSSSTDWSGIIGAVAAAVPTVASSIVQTQAQLSTIQLNAQRAAQGLPPIGSTSLLTGQGLTGSTGMLLMLGLGLVAVLAMGGKGGSSSTV